MDDLLVPTGPYTKGGNHFSNGATWIEQLGESFGLNTNVQPAFRSSSPHATNYAVGGARSTDVDLTFDLTEQVGTFLAEHGYVAPSDALYVIDFGGNDLRDALGVWILTGQNDAAANAVIDAAIASIEFHVNWLSTLGASKFLFVNVANIGSLPSVQILNALIPGAAAKAAQLTDDFNAGLDDVIASLPAGTEISVLDVFGTVEQLITAPFLFGLTNVMDACINATCLRLVAKDRTNSCFGTAFIRLKRFTLFSPPKQPTCWDRKRIKTGRFRFATKRTPIASGGNGDQSNWYASWGRALSHQKMPAALLNSKGDTPMGVRKAERVPPLPTFSVRKIVFINDKKATYYSHRREKATRRSRAKALTKSPTRFKPFF